jgi:hypothetical protein
MQPAANVRHGEPRPSVRSIARASEKWRQDSSLAEQGRAQIAQAKLCET